MKDIARAITKMIDFYNCNSDRNLHDINHFMKVWGFAHTIGVEEELDVETQKTLELAAIVHDIACPLCRKKYGNTDGKYQEQEGVLLARDFYADFELSREMKERICYIVGHHHTYESVDGIDYQIMLEADFLVNADESKQYRAVVKQFRERVFKTKTGIKLLESMYQ